MGRCAAAALRLRCAMQACRLLQAGAASQCGEMSNAPYMYLQAQKPLGRVCSTTAACDPMQSSHSSTPASLAIGQRTRQRLYALHLRPCRQEATGVQCLGVCSMAVLQPLPHSSSQLRHSPCTHQTCEHETHAQSHNGLAHPPPHLKVPAALGRCSPCSPLAAGVAIARQRPAAPAVPPASAPPAPLRHQSLGLLLQTSVLLLRGRRCRCTASSAGGCLSAHSCWFTGAGAGKRSCCPLPAPPAGSLAAAAAGPAADCLHCSAISPTSWGSSAAAQAAAQPG